MTETKNFKIDRPVKGKKYEEETAVTQLSAAEFLAEVDAILAIPGVKKLRWSQYTPYFNDGEPCEFSLNEPTVKLSKTAFGKTKNLGDEEDGWVSYYELYQRKDNASMNGVPHPGQYRDFSGTFEEWQEAYELWDRQNKVFELNGTSTLDIYTAMVSFAQKAGAMETVAKANFGDHAEITATAEGFEVESYDHD
jgi:hypothetical protein